MRTATCSLKTIARNIHVYSLTVKSIVKLTHKIHNNENSININDFNRNN